MRIWRGWWRKVDRIQLGYEAEGVDFPDHFLCRIFEDGVPMIIDCIDGGYAHVEDELVMRDDFGRLERAKIKSVADAGVLLLRMMHDLARNLMAADRMNDARVIRKLRSTLR